MIKKDVPSLKTKYNKENKNWKSSWPDMYTSGGLEVFKRNGVKFLYAFPSILKIGQQNKRGYISQQQFGCTPRLNTTNAVFASKM